MKSVQSVVARMNAARAKGARAMWYAVAMDTLLDIFLKQETVSREELKAELALRRDKYADQELLRAGYAEAIEQLTDPISPSAD